MTKKVDNSEENLHQNFIEPYGLKMNISDDTIEITGIVDTLSEKYKIKKLISDIYEDKKLDMGISISTDGAIDDQDVEMEVAEEIAGHPELKGKVTAEVDNGVAYIYGNVKEEGIKQKAVNTAARARGVTKVVDKIEVKEDINMENPEEIFHSQVRNDRE